uniref:Uncharacterized protein n=1 Tax=Panagrolaimus davidi TaxID=227884 RepID=A0A914QRY6_9BILA
MEQAQSQETPAAIPAAAEETNDFRINIPGRGATNFVIGVGVITVVFLLFYGFYDILKEIFSLKLKNPTPDENEFGYHWLQSLFHMINSLSTLADEIFTKNSWGFVILSTTEFLGLFFLLSWYYVLIQVSFGQYKIAKELYSTNSTTVPTRIPIILPSSNPQSPRQSQPQINIMENDNNDSSETPLSPFNT